MPPSKCSGFKRPSKNIETVPSTPPVKEHETTVKISVGRSPRVTYHVNKNNLCRQFPFFLAAFNSKFIEGQSQSKELEDVDHTTVDSLLYWLDKKRPFNAPMLFNAAGGTLKRLASLAILADRFLMADLADAALASLKQFFPVLLGPEVLAIIEQAYTGKEGSSLKAAMVEKLAEKTRKHVEEWMEVLPERVAKDVAIQVVKQYQAYEKEMRDITDKMSQTREQWNVCREICGARR